MSNEEFEALVTRLLDTKSITAKEAVELLKRPEKEYVYIDRPVYYDYLSRPWTFPVYTTTYANTSTDTPTIN